MKIHKRGETQIAEFIVFVILLVCHVFPLQANVAVVRNLDNGSGLQDPQVNCITKDSKGFIWFGTLNTIQRFDGVRFKCFNFPEWVEKVFVIKEIENNDFWVGTNKGLWKYEVRSGTFLRIYAEINFPVRSLCYINGKVYVGTSNGIYIIDTKQKMEHLRVTDEVSAYNQIIGAYATAKDIWFLSPEGVIAYTLSTGSIRVYGKEAKLTSKFSCIVGDDKQLYIGTTTHGVVAFDMLSGKYSSFLPMVGNNRISALSLHDGILCCGTLGSGVSFISLPEQEIVHSISTMPNDNDEYLTSDMVSCLLLDDLNVLWIGGTRYTGIDYLQFRNKAFHSYRIRNQELRNITFDCLYLVDDVKLLGTPNGFYYICNSKSQIEYFPSSPERFSFGAISTFIKFNDDILIGTKGGGAYKLNRQTLQISRFTDINLTVNSFTIDNQGRLWMTTLDGLHCYNEQLKVEKSRQRTMTGAELKELVRAYVEGCEGGFVPFNRGSLPIVSGIAVEVKENNGSYTLTGITRNGQPLRDDDTVTVTCLATEKQMAALPASESGTSAGEDTWVKNTWRDHVSGGGAALAEPENYITLR